MRFPLEKYKYVTYTNENGSREIAAITTYGGRYVKAVAKCNPVDEYNEDAGKELAAARCNVKVAQKRVIAAVKAEKEAIRELEAAKKRYLAMQQFRIDAGMELQTAKTELADIIDNI